MSHSWRAKTHKIYAMLQRIINVIQNKHEKERVSVPGAREGKREPSAEQEERRVLMRGIGMRDNGISISTSAVQYFCKNVTGSQ